MQGGQRLEPEEDQRQLALRRHKRQGRVKQQQADDEKWDQSWGFWFKC